MTARLGSHRTPRWRGMDSNFQYAEAVKMGCRPFFLRRLLRTGRRTGRRAAVQLFFLAESHWTEPGSYDIDRPTPFALIAASFEDRVHLAEEQEVRIHFPPAVSLQTFGS